MRIYVFLADLLELCTKTILSFLLNLGLIFAIEVSEIFAWFCSKKPFVEVGQFFKNNSK